MAASDYVPKSFNYRLRLSGRPQMESGHQCHGLSAPQGKLGKTAMFKVHVDISLFTNDAAFGMISGHLDLSVIPQVGDKLSFRMTEEIEARCGVVPFGGLLSVTHRIIAADGDLPVSLALEDLTAKTSDDAGKIIAMLEANYGLFADVWEG
jgi:hypothetical protein